MNTSDKIPAPCQWHDDLTAYARGELDLLNRRSLSDHLAHCPSCASELADITNIIGEIETLPPVQPDRNLVGPIMSAIGRSNAVRSRWIHAASAAAVILCIATTMFVFEQFRSKDPVSPVNRAVAWLCNTQSSDGSWHADRWNANPQFEVALAGLAISAIASDDSRENDSLRHQAVAKGTRYLFNHQNTDGRFGPAISAAPYNHALATVALLDCISAAGAPAAVHKALNHISATQLPDGGWGYLDATEGKPNLAITVWYLSTLRLARSIGQEINLAVYNRGMEWLTHNYEAGGGFAYTTQPHSENTPTLTAMGSLCFLDVIATHTINPRKLIADVEHAASTRSKEIDYYRSYFLIAALQQSTSVSAPDIVNTLRGELVATQTRKGAGSGSWEKPDRWSPMGGQVYATAMATMTLKPRRHQN